MAKFQITAPRYIDGVYYAASPEQPLILELADGVKRNAKLVPLDEVGEAPKAPIPPRFTHPHSTARDVKTDMVVLGAGREVGTRQGATVVSSAYLGKQEEINEALAAEGEGASPEPLSAEEKQAQYAHTELEPPEAGGTGGHKKHGHKRGRSSDNEP